MNGVVYLTARRLRHEPLAPLLLIASLALALWLPTATRSLIGRFEAALTARAGATPLVAGAAGSSLDLVLASLYFRDGRLDPVPAALWDELVATGSGVAVPLLVGQRVQGYPLVGTGIEYFDARGLALAAGDRPLLPGEIVLGAEVAAALGAAPGARLFSDQDELYDLSVPPALALQVVGVLEPSGGPDDRAAFTDVVTCWAVAGLAHGHVDADEVTDPQLVLAELESGRILSPALIASNDPIGDGLADFHVHGDRETLPLTSVLFFPRDERARTLVATAIDEREERLMVAPRAVVEELMSVVFRVRGLLDLFAALLGVTTLVLGALVLGLSTRLRTAELATLDRLGASSATAARLVAFEILLEIAAAVGVAVLGLGLLLAVVPDPVRWL